MSINPYKELGDFEPFNLVPDFAVLSAFKKTACAGISGRAKSEKQDIEEAIFALKRAIDASDNCGYICTIGMSYAAHEVIVKYRAVFGDSLRLDAAKLILLFVETNNSGYLKDAVSLLQHSVLNKV